MSTVSPAASFPARRRDGNWGEAHPSYSYEFENGSPYSRSHPHPGPPPSPYYGPPPSRGHPPPQDYWSHEAHRGGGGYWGPPASYDTYQPTERHMPPPARVPRGPPQHQRSPRTLQSDDQPAPHLRIPSSPRGVYPRDYTPSQPKRDFHHPQASHGGYPPETMPKDKRKGDPLSILANVSAGMTGKDGQKQHRGASAHETRRHVPMTAPTSPLQRRTRPSPITPNQTPPESKQRAQRHQITPTSSSRTQEQPPSWDHQPEQGYMEYPPPAYYPPRRRLIPPYGDYGSPGHHEGNPPALVERGSFDSQDGPYRDGSNPIGTPQSRGYYYDEPPYGHYWEGGPQQTAHGPYPPPRWNYGPPEPFHSEYAYEALDEAFAHHRPPPPLPTHHTAPYTYVQQPRLEEKTILRKKFSWKHYPEVSCCSRKMFESKLQHMMDCS
jgi:hypothetical protein